MPSWSPALDRSSKLDSSNTITKTVKIGRDPRLYELPDQQLLGPARSTDNQYTADLPYMANLLSVNN